MDKYGSNNYRINQGLAGPTGKTGMTGATGQTAGTGPTGATGKTGATGIGITGATGNGGMTGTTGTTPTPITFATIDRSTILVPVTIAGTVKTYTGLFAVLKVFTGGVEQDISGDTVTVATTDCTVTQGIEASGTGMGRKLTITNLAADTGSFVVTHTVDGTLVSQRVYIAKTYDGSTGLTGGTASTGPTGVAGVTGATGLTGIVGATGKTGTTGTAGAAGPQGDIGVTGATSGTGATGATGTNGTNGITGATGADGTGLKSVTVVIDEYDQTNNMLTGIEIVPAVVGKVIWPIFVKAKITDYGSAYDYGTSKLILRYSGSATALMTWTNAFLESAAERTDVMPNVGTYEANTEGWSLKAYSDSTNATSGSSGNIEITVFYVEL